jgi:hypothetical protein
MSSKNLNTLENLREACKINNLDLYLNQYLAKYNEFSMSDSSGYYECIITKIDDKYKLRITVYQTCLGKNYCPYELVHYFNNSFEIFENEYLNQSSDYSGFKENYDRYITDSDALANLS